MEQDMVQQEAPARRLSGTDMGGAMLIFMGVALVAVNLLGLRHLENWWSFFIFLPGGLFWGVGQLLASRNGRSSFFSRSSKGIGLIIITVAFLFLLNLSWEVWWPVMLMMPGVAFWLVGGTKGSVGVTAVLRLGRWIGVTMILLGGTFLAEQLNLINLHALFGDFHWWGLFPLIPGVGALIEGLRVLQHSGWAATILLIASVWIISSGLMEIFDPNWLSWEGMVGIGLIGTGLLSRVWLFAQPDADA